MKVCAQWVLPIVVVVAAAAMGVTVEGKTWIVGDTQGWSATNYPAWLQGKTFAVGDELVFPYSQGSQDVAEVSQVDYEACNGRSPLNHWINGDTHVTLTTPGTKYYICTFPGHCPPVRLAITVAPATTNSTTAETNQDAANVNTINTQQQGSPPPPYNSNNASNSNDAVLSRYPFLLLLAYVPMVWVLLL